MSFNTLKVFDYRDMSKDARLAFLESNRMTKDWYVGWNVGPYDPLSVWLLANGAKANELVLIYNWR